MKQVILKYKGYAWDKGTRYAAVFSELDEVEVCCPLFSPANWQLDGVSYTLRCGSNTCSTLCRNAVEAIGEIHQACDQWEVHYLPETYALHQLKRGFILKSSAGFLASFRVNAIGRITGRYAETKNVPLPLLLYVVVNLRAQ